MLKLICLGALAFVAAQAQLASVEETLKKDGPESFVYNPLLRGANATLQSAGGISQPRQKKQWPQLATVDISQTFFRLQPCALRPPHVHPFASGMLYLISGGNFSVGLVTEEGLPIVNYISSGASAIFPVGLIHYQQNLDCQEATYTISYNKASPGTQVTLKTLFKLPASAVAPVMGLNASAYNAIVTEGKAQDAFVTMTDPECVARCKGAMATAPATAAGR